MFENVSLIHIIAEVLIIGALFFWFTTRNKKLSSRLDELQHQLELQGEVIEYIQNNLPGGGKKIKNNPVEESYQSDEHLLQKEVEQTSPNTQNSQNISDESVNEELYFLNPETLLGVSELEKSYSAPSNSATNPSTISFQKDILDISKEKVNEVKDLVQDFKDDSLNELHILPPSKESYQDNSENPVEENLQE